MSMISAQIDELRKSADEWNGSNMFELARMCNKAADTIWQLREDLQRANAENAKLREDLEFANNGWEKDSIEFLNLQAENAKLREKIKALTELASIGKLTASQCTELAEDNAKLRELIADVHESLKADKAGMFHNLTLSAMEDDMRELGIEVDE